MNVTFFRPLPSVVAFVESLLCPHAAAPASMAIEPRIAIALLKMVFFIPCDFP